MRSRLVLTYRRNRFVSSPTMPRTVILPTVRYSAVNRSKGPLLQRLGHDHSPAVVHLVTPISRSQSSDTGGFKSLGHKPQYSVERLRARQRLRAPAPLDPRAGACGDGLDA